MLSKVYKDKYIVYENGSVYSLYTKSFLKPWKQNSGYLMIQCGKNDKWLLHRLVMAVFHGKSDLTVDHIDGNKLNNNLSNLEYVTQAENNKRAKLKNSKRVLYNGSVFTSGKELANFLKIDDSYVYKNIREGKKVIGFIPVLLGDNRQ